MQVSVEICSTATEGLEAIGKKLGFRSILRQAQGSPQKAAKSVSFVDSRLGQPLAQVHIFEQGEEEEGSGGKKTCCELF